MDHKLLESKFKSLPVENRYEELSKDLMSEYDTNNRDRPHIKILKSKLKLLEINDDLSNEILELLSVPEHPFLEKTNIFLLYRRFYRYKTNLHDLSVKIAGESAAFQKGDRNGSADYIQVIDHFGSDILAQMYRDCRKDLPYAGLSVLIDLSQGIPRNLLSILAHIYRRSLFAGERPFTEGLISIKSQTDGVIDGANWFWLDAQPDNNANETRNSIESLSLLFRSIRYSDAPSECDLCTFTINTESLSEDGRRSLKIAENWSYLIRIPSGGKNRNHRAIDEKFQLAPVLSPKWGLSHHRRGSIELQPNLGLAIFDSKYRDNLITLVKKRIENMSFVDRAFASNNENQKDLFQ